MCVVDDNGDRFRPQGASSPLLTPLDENSQPSSPLLTPLDENSQPSSPLLTPLDENSQPSSIECHENQKSQTPPMNFCENQISQNEFLKVDPAKFSENEIASAQNSSLVEFSNDEGKMTNFKPKILSPCDKSLSTENKYRRKSADHFRRKSQEEMQQTKRKSMRRLSNDLGCKVLPSRSGIFRHI